MVYDDYEINLSTLLIVPIDQKNSRVYETNNEFVVKKSSSEIIKNSCLFFGSSYDGRVQATKNLINCKMKLPIIIEESNNLIFFPTSSIRNDDCVWISFNNLIKYSKNSEYSTILYFKENKNIEINIRYNIIDNQVIRAIKLDSLWNKRKN